MKKQNKDYYVYLLIDPRDNQVFYVGKGINFRTFHHEYNADLIGDNSESKKIQTINEIKEAGYEIKREIYPNMTEDESFNLEAVLINTYRNRNPEKMTNIQSGHHCDWLMTPEKYKDIFDEADNYEDYLNGEKIVFINPQRSFDYNDDYETRYNKFRNGWKFNINRVKKADYIFIIINHKVKYVYKPKDFILNDYNTYMFDGELLKDNIFTNKKCNIKFTQLGWKYNF